MNFKYKTTSKQTYVIPEFYYVKPVYLPQPENRKTCEFSHTMRYILLEAGNGMKS